MMFTRTFTIVALLAVANAKNLRSNDPVLNGCNDGMQGWFDCINKCSQKGASSAQCLLDTDVMSPDFNTFQCACCMCKTGVCSSMWPGTQCANNNNDTVKEEIETPDTENPSIETPDTIITLFQSYERLEEINYALISAFAECNDDGYCDCNQAPDDTVKKTNKTNDRCITPVV